ncbi:hypothetical protein CONPUDRAFT_28448, partial [Coniophora puteana RWD-64-598 SS2]
LSGLEPVLYNCCINSCCCYLGPNADLECCLHYDASQFCPSSCIVHQKFFYIPTIPHLVPFYKNPEMHAKMQY